jgi:hypothetical protein
MKEMMVGSAAPVGPVGRWGAAPPQALLERMKDYGQEGAFALWDELSPEDRDLLVQDIEVSPMPPPFPSSQGKIYFLVGGEKIWFCIGRWNCRPRFCSESWFFVLHICLRVGMNSVLVWSSAC